MASSAWFVKKQTVRVITSCYIYLCIFVQNVFDKHYLLLPLPSIPHPIFDTHPTTKTFCIRIYYILHYILSSDSTKLRQCDKHTYSMVNTFCVPTAVHSFIDWHYDPCTSNVAGTGNTRQLINADRDSFLPAALPGAGDSRSVDGRLINYICTHSIPRIWNHIESCTACNGI
jgi:hypothetical protein